MVNQPYPPTLNYPSYQSDARLTEGVISRRFWAYLIDLVVIGLWVVLISIAIFFLGIIFFPFVAFFFPIIFVFVEEKHP